MPYQIKRIFFVLLAVAMLVLMSACGSSEPCNSCGNTPTKGYTNNSSGEKEYYCADCSSDCEFCSKDATEYYTSGLGIVFVCEECYEDIKEMNS